MLFPLNLDYYNPQPYSISIYYLVVFYRSFQLISRKKENTCKRLGILLLFIFSMIFLIEVSQLPYPVAYPFWSYSSSNCRFVLQKHGYWSNLSIRFPYYFVSHANKNGSILANPEKSYSISLHKALWHQKYCVYELTIVLRQATPSALSSWQNGALIVSKIGLTYHALCAKSSCMKYFFFDHVK